MVGEIVAERRSRNGQESSVKRFTSSFVRGTAFGVGTIVSRRTLVPLLFCGSYSSRIIWKGVPVPSDAPILRGVANFGPYPVCRAGDVARAEIILEESEKRSGSWPQADTYSYYALMRHYAEKGDSQKVQAVSILILSGSTLIVLGFCYSWRVFLGLQYSTCCRSWPLSLVLWPDNLRKISSFSFEALFSLLSIGGTKPSPPSHLLSFTKGGNPSLTDRSLPTF